MTVKEAYEKVKADNKDMVLISCFELDYCFAFMFCPPDWVGEHFAKAFDAVLKDTGEIGSICTHDDFEGFDRAKKIDISQFEQP